jgi:hypothetical protein
VEAVRGCVAAGFQAQLTTTTNKAVAVLRRKAETIACPKTAEVFRRAMTVSRFLHRRRPVLRPCRPEKVEQRATGLADDTGLERIGCARCRSAPPTTWWCSWMRPACWIRPTPC